MCLSLPTYVFSDNLENMIANLISDKLGNISDIELSFDYKAKILLPRIRDKNIKNIQLVYFAPNFSSFRVNVTMENEEVFDLFGRYNAYLEVPVTRKTMAIGTIVTESEVTTIRSSAGKVRPGYATSLSEIIGMQVKRPIASGNMIRHGDIVKPQVVRQGDGVEMVYSSGNIKLRTNGIASGGGAIGDTIRVKNESTGTIVSGVIKSKNLVEVGGE
jgi:flagella basal body P-ring formation protein FlgA